MIIFAIILNTINMASKKYLKYKDPDYSLLDNQTGEIIEWNRTKVVNIDEFIMFFFNSIPELLKLEGLQMKVLMCCWKASSYSSTNMEGNIIYNNKLLKEYIRSCGLEISDRTIDVIIHNLSNKNIISMSSP